MKFTWKEKFSLEAELWTGSHSLHGEVTPRDDGGFEWWIFTISSPPNDMQTRGASETIVEAIAAAEAALREFAAELEAEQEDAF